ncbi:hypothetical protein K402DRAFT_354735 [Aulographum hederae CBS 113979]|uniref:Uncharacterized protein n=1 Tax=Aulographum hederae CBS 113979 TaxID=1176131 RepID=A0A6G1H0H2_9PEZI|nr:hypothetical protein K402DRAFT_354735 [Aulographum hederae CBS 113979]
MASPVLPLSALAPTASTVPTAPATKRTAQLPLNEPSTKRAYRNDHDGGVDGDDLHNHGGGHDLHSHDGDVDRDDLHDYDGGADRDFMGAAVVQEDETEEGDEDDVEAGTDDELDAEDDEPEERAKEFLLLTDYFTVSKENREKLPPTGTAELCHARLLNSCKRLSQDAFNNDVSKDFKEYLISWTPQMLARHVVKQLPSDVVEFHSGDLTLDRLSQLPTADTKLPLRGVYALTSQVVYVGSSGSIRYRFYYKTKGHFALLRKALREGSSKKVFYNLCAKKNIMLDIKFLAIETEDEDLLFLEIVENVLVCTL